MCNVYEDSWLTPMATKAKDGRDGLFLDQKSRPVATRVDDPRIPGRLFIRELNRSQWYLLDNPLLKRASVF